MPSQNASQSPARHRQSPPRHRQSPPRHRQSPAPHRQSPPRRRPSAAAASQASAPNTASTASNESTLGRNATWEERQMARARHFVGHAQRMMNTMETIGDRLEDDVLSIYNLSIVLIRCVTPVLFVLLFLHGPCALSDQCPQWDPFLCEFEDCGAYRTSHRLHLDATITICFSFAWGAFISWKKREIYMYNTRQWRVVNIVVMAALRTVLPTFLIVFCLRTVLPKSLVDPDRDVVSTLLIPSLKAGRFFVSMDIAWYSSSYALVNYTVPVLKFIFTYPKIIFFSLLFFLAWEVGLAQFQMVCANDELDKARDLLLPKEGKPWHSKESLAFIDSALRHLDRTQWLVPTCFIQSMLPTEWQNSRAFLWNDRCVGKEMREDIGQIAEMVGLEAKLDSHNCDDVLKITAEKLFPRAKKLITESVPFMHCSYTTSYSTCAAMQAERLKREKRRANLPEICFLVLMRANAYEECGYVSSSTFAYVAGTEQSHQSRELLKKISSQLCVSTAIVSGRSAAKAKAPCGKREKASQNALKIMDGVFELRSELVLPNVLESAQACDTRIFNKFLPSARRLLEVRISGSFAIPAHRLLLEHKRCNNELDDLVAEITKLDVNMLDWSIYAMLGEAYEKQAQHVRTKNIRKERDFLRKALRAYENAYDFTPTLEVLVSWRLYDKILTIKAKMEPGSSAHKGGDRNSRETTCLEKPLAGDDYYVLGVSRNCNRASLRSAYKAKALKYHPDKYQGTKLCAQMHFLRIQLAYENLRSKC